MATIQFTIAPPSSSPSLLGLRFKPRPTKLFAFSPNLTVKPSFKASLKPFNFISPSTFHSLEAIKPYVLSEYKPILKGWFCSLVSVYSLSKIVPKVGKFSATLSKIDAIHLRDEGLVLGVLLLARLVASYWQQAFLWDAALNSVYKVRVFAFDKVLQRDLEFFEGGDAVSPGDIAYRMTAEASDVADTVHALLNTIVPSALQLSAMATQMLFISPTLSLISALVIPFMSLVIAHLGERLRKISKRAHLSIAALSAYLNEILPSILFVKASNAELSESARFRRLAHTDLSERLKKRKMKALIPQIMQIIYFGALSIFFVGSLVVPSGALDGSLLVSFVTSLVLLIDPIQGVGKAYNELKQGEPAIERLFDLTRFESQTLLSGTVVENIGYRDLMTTIDMERVELAAQTANADEFIRNLSEGYQTNIGPRGSTLSGGQKQRIAIARALYQNCSILILDEATSALDSRSELLVRQAVERLMENRTVLVIAHRLETVLMAKRVFLLDDGKLEELNRSALLGGKSDSLLSTGLVI
ncbi:ABC transporter B family member 29, chloroplastic isoform X2 [Vitis vinifera]|uniref:ABC transporter B family member 29, chloroplastic isoform X2 n=1 Tax=Vitis vinifera TaxID=29760 RepID=UPI002882FFEC|nr:ABC transporter B family member 29, chloroplastic isoform X2 [Vitis vinifera]